MVLSYHISEREYEELRNADFNKMDAGSLRYYYTFGTVNYVSDFPQFNILTCHTPVLDHALALRWVVNRLNDTDTQKLSFTENDNHIVFERTNDGIRITADWRDWSCFCPVYELQAMSEKLLQDVTSDVCAAVPEMSEFLIGPNRII